MKNWVLNRVISSCNACFKPILLILMLGLVSTGCGSSKNVDKGSKLAGQYQRAIGCSDYGRLRPSVGDHESVLGACEESLKNEFSTAEVITAFVYRSLNKGVLFVHMVYRIGPDAPREGYNFLVDNEEAEVLGGYRCGPG